MTASSNLARVSPIMSLRIAVATDPFSAALGYGTNLVDEPEADVKPYHDGSRWDYMVTAPYANGLDGESEAVDAVAYALRPPTSALRPFARPLLAASDRAIAAARQGRLRGEQHGRTGAAHPRSPSNGYRATPRHDTTFGDTDARPLMESRPSGGLRPIGPGGEENDGPFVYLADRYFAIPNDPGKPIRPLLGRHQDLFGI